MATEQNIQEHIEVIRNETQKHGNTRQRVADVLTELNDSKVDKLELESELSQMSDDFNFDLSKKLDKPTASGAYIVLKNPSTGAVEYSAIALTPGYMPFWISNSFQQSDLYFNGTNFGFGKTDPSEKIDVVGRIRANGLRLNNSTSSSVPGEIKFKNNIFYATGNDGIEKRILREGDLHTHSISDIIGLQNSLDLFDISITNLQNNKADLVDGKVPSSQLPSYVDDVLEFANLASFPATGESGKIYVALNTNLTYRWSGTTYAEISPSLALGETFSTAYRGDRGKTAYDHSQTIGNPHGTTKGDIGLGNVDNTSDANKPISTATQTALNGKENIISVGNTSQYFRGDKTWQTLNSSAVGLGNVPNVDATNPANITQSASYRFVTDTEKATWNAKQNALTNPITGTGTTNYIPKFTSSGTVGNSSIYETSTNLIIGGTSFANGHTASKLNVLGDVWIGDYNSPKKLNLEGNIELKTLDKTLGGIKLNNVDGNNGGITLQYVANNVINDGLVLNYSGNVGIGASPSEKLDVNGNVKATSFIKSGGTSTQFLMADGSTNSNTYAKTDGTNATGNWGISITGNAATATTLQTARTINGTSFNGSANITTANWGTGRTITIGSTGKTVDGSGNVSWTLAEIGAYAATNPNGYTSNTGTVTSVSGTGGYGGLTLSGTVTSSGSLTLGGTPSGTWPISITGSSGSVSGLTLNSSSNWIDPDNVTQNQIGYNANVSLFGQTDGGLYSSAYSSSWIHQIYGDFRSGQIAVRGKSNGTWQAWRTVLDSGNYTSYSPSLTGSGASGTWGINISGNASTASSTTVVGVHSGNEVNLGGGYTGGGTLYVNYNDGGSYTNMSFYNGGTSLCQLTASQFNGALSGNATTATTLQTARTLTIGATGKTFNGSANVAWTLAEIGAQAALTNPITGTATSGQVAFFNGTTTQTGDANLFWDNTNKRLGIGTTTPSYKLDVNGDVRISQSIMGGGVTPSGTSYSSYAINGNIEGYGGFNFNTRSDVDGDSFGSVGISLEPDGGVFLYNYSLDYIAQSYISFSPYDFTMQSGGDFVFRTKPSTTYQTSLIIKNTGNVGIGTTTPSEKLEVNGNIKSIDIIDQQGISIYLKLKTVNGNVTIDNSYHNKIVRITASCTITIPNNLRTDFNCTFEVIGAYTAQFVDGSGATTSAPFGRYLKTDLTAMFYCTGTASNYRLNGSLATS